MADFDLSNLSSDPEALVDVFNKLEAGENLDSTPVDPPVDPPKDEPKAEQTEVGKETQTQQTEPEGTEPAGVATKDGKHVIPYSVLKSERDRATRAEQIAKDMQDRIAQLESAVQNQNQGAKSGESARTETPEPTAEQLSQEDLELLKDDFPTVYKAVMASMAAAKALEAKLQPMTEKMANAEAEQARTTQEAVQDAIDSVPKMAHIQANDTEAFELAKQFDATLRSQAKWADKPLSERFAKVVEMVEAATGEQIAVPGQANQTQQSPADLRKAAIAAAQAAAKATKTNVPTSLSEFGAGDPAATDERQAAESMSPLQLAERMSKMTPDQMEAYFASL